MSTTDDTLGSAIRSTTNDACVQALEKNWTAILASALLEVIQWLWDELCAWIAPANWVVWLVGLIPIVGPAASKLLEAVMIAPFRIDWSATYASGALGDISMARNNTACAANTYFETKEILKVDKAFASDSDYYLNSI